MDLEKIIAQLQKDPAKMGKVLDSVKDGNVESVLKAYGIQLGPDKIAELVKKLTTDGDLRKKGEALLGTKEGKELLNKGGDLLKGLLNNKK